MERYLPGAERRGGGESLFNGYRVSAGEDKNIQGIDDNNHYRALCMYLMPVNLNCKPKNG